MGRALRKSNFSHQWEGSYMTYMNEIYFNGSHIAPFPLDGSLARGEIMDIGEGNEGEIEEVMEGAFEDELWIGE